MTAPSANAVVVVGYQNGSDGGPLSALIDRWDGQQWQEDPIPAEAGSAQLTGVSGSSASDMWAVGTNDAASAVALHWDGSAWTSVRTPVTNGTAWLESVDDISPTDVWAAGVVFGSGGNVALAEHWDGTAWSVVSTPGGSSQPSLDAVSASGSTDIWVAGQAGPSFEIQHGTGGSLAVVDNPSAATPMALGGLVALAPSDVWATGGAVGATATVPWVRHWDGNSWSYASVPTPGAGGLFRAIAGQTGNLWAVGYTPVAGTQYDNLAAHWDGSAWSYVPIPSPSSTYNDASAAAVSPDMHLWVAGLVETANGVVDGAVYSTSVACGPGTTPPTVSAAPAASLNQFTQFGTSARSVALPITVGWQVTPGSSPVCSTQLQRSENGGTWTPVPLSSATATASTDTLTTPNTDVDYEVNITDCDGGSSGWVAGPTFKYNLFQQTSDRWLFSPTSAWRVADSFHFSGRSTSFTTVAGASATLQLYNAESVGLIMETGPHRGSAAVSVDGGPPATISTNAPVNGFRLITFTTSWSTPGPHTVQVTNLATAGSPRIDIDGAVVILGP